MNKSKKMIAGCAICLAFVFGTGSIAEALPKPAQTERVASRKAAAEKAATAKKVEVKKEDITKERCHVALKQCGSKVRESDRAKRTSANQKKALSKGCWMFWCKSAKTGKIFSRKKAEVDHIVPIACGGNNSLDNLQVLSREENRLKGGKCPK